MKTLTRHDVRGLACNTYGYEICKHCINMLCRAIEGRGEYIVMRCERCGLAVDSRKIDRWKRAYMLESKARYETFQENFRLMEQAKNGL